MEGLRDKGLVFGFVVLALALVLSPGGRASSEASNFCRLSSAESALAATVRDGQRELPSGVVLLAHPSPVIAGRVAYARLANFGSTSASYGRAFSIEHRAPAGWELDPASPEGPWPKIAVRLHPDRAGRCYAFKVPAGHPPGLYRFSTKVQIRPGTKRGMFRKYATFRVQSPPKR